VHPDKSGLPSGTIEPTVPDIERHGRLLAIAGVMFYTGASVSHTCYHIPPNSATYSL